MNNKYKTILRKTLFYLCFCMFLALGISCVLNFYTICVFHDSSKYPYLYPFVMAMMPVSFLVCLAMFIYALKKCIAKGEESSAKNTGKMLGRGIGIAIIGTIPAFVIVSYIMEFVGRLF